MTKNILIIGDSHSAKLGFNLGKTLSSKIKSAFRQESDHQYRTKYLDKTGHEVWMEDGLVTYKDDHIKFFISSHPGRSALHYDFENFASGTQKEVLDEWNSEDNIIMPWLGYIDVRNWLPQTELKNYVDVDLFNSSKIALEWMDYSTYQEYPQLSSTFNHNVSIIDLILNNGFDSRKYLLY
jgi:hypothetical protein